jgi:hypothetical protein
MIFRSDARPWGDMAIIITQDMAISNFISAPPCRTPSAFNEATMIVDRHFPVLQPPGGKAMEATIKPLKSTPLIARSFENCNSYSKPGMDIPGLPLSCGDMPLCLPPRAPVGSRLLMLNKSTKTKTLRRSQQMALPISGIKGTLQRNHIALWKQQHITKLTSPQGQISLSPQSS